MLVDDQDLERRLRETLRRKADQLDTSVVGSVVETDVVELAPAGRRRSVGLVLALAGMAAVLILGIVVIAREDGSDSDSIGTADSVPVDAPLPSWLPEGMDVWEVTSQDVGQTSVVVLAETSSGRTIDIQVMDDTRAPTVALTGAFPVGNELGFYQDGTSIAWVEPERAFRAIGKGLDAQEITDVMHQTTLRADGTGYTAATVPEGWTLAETRVEPPAVATTARFAYRAPDATSWDLMVSLTLADGDGDGAGWTNAATYLAPDADGEIWTLPGDLNGYSSVSMVDRDGHAVSVGSSGPDRLDQEQLLDLVEQILDGPSDQLTSLKGRAEANIAGTPIVASATTEDRLTIRVYGSDSGGVAAICTEKGAESECAPHLSGTVDVPDLPPGTFAPGAGFAYDDAGSKVVIGATRGEPSFPDLYRDQPQLAEEPWIVEADGWYIFRAVPSSPLFDVSVQVGDSMFFVSSIEGG